MGLYVVPVTAVNNLSAGDAPTLTVIVVSDTATVGIDLPPALSIVGLGYVLVELLPSIVQVKLSELSAITTPSSIVKPCPVPIVSSNNPVAGSYVASVGVHCLLVPAFPTLTVIVLVDVPVTLV